jgi:drug/metabolite transporter (DMT)-like permease
MKPVNFLLLLILSVIWGGSFIFTRILAPVLGPFLTADLRLLVGGAVLLPFVWVILRKDRRKLPLGFLLVLGIFNSGIPFLLYSFAALHIPGSVSSITNSLTPVFTALYAAIWLGEAFTFRKGMGLVLGVTGVALISAGGSFVLTPWSLLAVLAGVGATNFYALSGVAIKRRGLKIHPIVMAGMTQFAAGVAILPVSLAFPVPGPVTGGTIIMVLAFGSLCSGLAYVIYFRLIAQEGPTRALSVTFLIPVFGVFWGNLFLKETIDVFTILGMAVILTGTYLVVAPGRGRRRTGNGSGSEAVPAAEPSLTSEERL